MTPMKIETKLKEINELLDKAQPHLIYCMEDELTGRNSFEGDDHDFVKNIEQKIALRNHAPYFIETLKWLLEDLTVEDNDS